MKKLKFIFISFLYVLLWGICFLDVEADRFSCMAGLLITFISTVYLKKEAVYLTISDKFVVLSLPILYLVVLVVLRLSEDLNKIIFNPLNLALLLLIWTLFGSPMKNKSRNLLILSIAILGYSYTFFPKFHSKAIEKELTFIESNAPLETIDLSDFNFLNPNGSVHDFNSTQKKAFFTWNEDCAPCKRLIKDLSPSFDRADIDYYLIYIPFRNSHFDPSDLSNFLPPKNKAIFLNDAAQEIKNKLNIGSTPLVLLLNGNEIHYSTIGYNSKKKTEILQNLNSL